MRRPIFETLNFHFYNMAKAHPFKSKNAGFFFFAFLTCLLSVFECIHFSISKPTAVTTKSEGRMNPMYLVCKQARQGTLQFALSISAFSVIFPCQIINGLFSTVLTVYPYSLLRTPRRRDAYWPGWHVLEQ